MSASVRPAARGRPPGIAVIEETPARPPPLPPMGVIEWRRVDYAGLEAAMAFADEAIRTARRNLAVLATPPSPPAGSGSAGSVPHGADEDDEIAEIDIA
jgi:hypothetical protein